MFVLQIRPPIWKPPRKKLFQAQLVASSGRMLLFASRNHDAAFWQSLYTDLVLPPENAGFPQLPASEAAYSHTQLLFGPCIVNPHNVPRDLCWQQYKEGEEGAQQQGNVTPHINHSWNKTDHWCANKTDLDATRSYRKSVGPKLFQIARVFSRLWAQTRKNGRPLFVIVPWNHHLLLGVRGNSCV